MEVCTIKLLKDFPELELKKNKLYDAHEGVNNYHIFSSLWVWIPKKYCKFVGRGIKELNK